MSAEFLLPEIGEGVVEGEIVEWHVAPGDTVTQDQNLVSILTDKATVEISSDFQGVVSSLSGAAGDVIGVGTPLLTYRPAGSAAEAPAPPPAPRNNGQAAAKPEAGGAVLSYPLPEIGEGVIEGEVVEWHVAVGDTVTADQPLVSILTDKATVEITAPADGVVLELHGAPGESLHVGGEIMKLRTTEGGAAHLPRADHAPAPTEHLPAAPVAAVPAPKAAPAVTPEDNPSISAFGTPLATPAVRRQAAKLGVALETVVGSGPNHRILKSDVEAAAAAPAAAPAPAAASRASAAPAPAAPAPASVAHSRGERREKLRGLRKAIYTSMTRSKSTIPHFTFVDEIEMDKLVALRGALKAEAAREDVKLTYLPFIVKACVLALKKFPVLNASVDDAAGEIVYKADYNIGIATATPDGLTVPVLKAADTKTILEIATEIAALSDRARNRRSTMEDISGGTFTITSLGRLGGLFATPIINHPEVGIMGIHNLQERAVVRNGQVVVRQMMNLSVSFDHRVVDGDVGATFAQEVKAYLEEPGRLMLGMV